MSANRWQCVELQVCLWTCTCLNVCPRSVFECVSDSKHLHRGSGCVSMCVMEVQTSVCPGDRVCVCAWQELGLRVSVGRHVLMRLGQACVCCGKGRELRQQNSHSLPSPPAVGGGQGRGAWLTLTEISERLRRRRPRPFCHHPDRPAGWGGNWNLRRLPWA